MKEEWVSKNLGEVILTKENIKWGSESGKREYIDLSSVDRDSFEIVETSSIDHSNAPSRAKQIVNFGDVLFGSTRPTLKRVAIVSEEYHKQICSTGFTVLRPNQNKILTEFIFYILRSENFMSHVSELERGTSYPAVTDSDVKNYTFQLPPLSEQKQIVTILDEAFEAIDQAKANIEQNIKNAEELFQSKLNEIFSQRGEGWEEKVLDDVCKVERGSSPRPIKKYYTKDESGVNWIKIGDVNENDKYVYSTKQRITKEGALKSRFVDVGDFILSNSMSYGRPYIMKISGYIHDGWFVLRLPDDLNPDYFWQLLASPLLKEQFEYLAAGAIVKNISGDLVKKAKLPIPPLETQNQIVEETENLSDVTKSLYEFYQQKLKALEELKKSILQKAFLGELTANEHVAA